MNDTIFDKVLTKTVPANIVYEDAHVLAFSDINPQAPVHILVIPKKRATSLGDLDNWTTTELGTFLKSIPTVAHKLGLKDSGYRVVFNTGKNACQSVEYLHAHILGGTPLRGSFA